MDSVGLAFFHWASEETSTHHFTTAVFEDSHYKKTVTLKTFFFQQPIR
jgi:hypothetical protein